MTYKAFLLVFTLSGIICLNTFSQGTWTQVANYGGGAVTEARAFSIGAKGYIVATPQLWEYDAGTDTWTQMANFIGPNRLSGAAFSVGTKGYFGTGGTQNDFYEYDQATNTWMQLANFGGTGREGAVGCAVNGKGYIGLGGNYLADWWEYDPAANTWTQKANIGGPGRYHAGAFGIGAYGYVCTGFNGSFMNDLWQFDPVANAWTAKSNLPGTTRDRPVAIAMNGKGYIVSGWSGGMQLPDAWEYEPVTDSWTQIANYGGAARYNHCGFVIGSAMYVGTGYVAGSSDDIWKYGNACGVQAVATSTTCNNTCDATATVTVPDTNAAVSYIWSTVPVQTTVTATGLCGGSYIVTVTDTAGCTSSYAVNVSSPPPITGTMSAIPPTCNGASNGSLCVFATGGAGAPYCYTWPGGQTTACISGISAGSYTVILCDSAGCTGTVTGTLTQPSAMALSLSHFDATCQTCANGNATANVFGGNGPYFFAWSNGATGTAYIQNLLPGWYTCCVTDANGCTVCDSTYVNYPGGIFDAADDGIDIQPNPFNDYVFVKTSRPLVNPLVKLFDETGRIAEVMVSVTEKGIRITTEKIARGIYFVEIKDPKINYRSKIVKGD